MGEIFVPFTVSQEAQDFIRFLKSTGGTGNPAINVWAFDPKHPVENTPFPSTTRFRTASDLHFITPYVEGRLLFWDSERDQIRPGRRAVSVFLDSNALSIVRAVLVDGSRDERRFRAVLEIAEHYRVWNADVQAMPYLREIALRASLEDSTEDARKAIEAALRVQALDVNATGNSGEPRYKTQILKNIQTRIGGDTFEDASEILTQRMVGMGNPGYPADVINVYAAMLKMILVGLTMKNHSYECRCAAVEDFIVHRLGASQPRYFAWTRLFFAGHLQRLIKITPGDPKFAQRYIIGSAFDLYLTSVHEQFVGLSEAPDATLGVLCTADKGLADFAGRFPMQGVAVLSDASFRIFTLWDDTWLADLLTEQGLQALKDATDTKLPEVEHRRQADPRSVVEAVYALQDELGIADEHALLKQAIRDDFHIVM